MLFCRNKKNRGKKKWRNQREFYGGAQQSDKIQRIHLLECEMSLVYALIYIHSYHPDNFNSLLVNTRRVAGSFADSYRSLFHFPSTLSHVPR